MGTVEEADDESTKAKDLPVSIPRTAEELIVDERGVQSSKTAALASKFQSITAAISLVGSLQVAINWL